MYLMYLNTNISTIDIRLFFEIRYIYIHKLWYINQQVVGFLSALHTKTSESPMILKHHRAAGRDVWKIGTAQSYPGSTPLTSLESLWLINVYMGMDQYLLIPFLGGWASIYQLFWCSPGVQGFDTLPNVYINVDYLITHVWVTNNFF